MKAHKYWSIGAVVTMVGTFYTGYKGLKAAHKYFAFGSLICMMMAVYSGHKMISGNKRTRKQMEVKEAVSYTHLSPVVSLYTVSNSET